VLSTIHQLGGRFPDPDSYQEIQQTYMIPGGEAGNGALLISRWGGSTQLDGCFLGKQTRHPLLDYFGKNRVGTSLLHYEEGFEGWRDIVFCDGESRTVFGWFQKQFAHENRMWNRPDETTIHNARCVLIDPFFPGTSDEAARLCQKHQKDYVTLDSPWDSLLAREARAIICSREFLDQQYPCTNPRDLLQHYLQYCRGLVIFTFGKEQILYARKGITSEAVFTPYQIKVADTLAAGDTFRAAVGWAILQGMEEEEVVQFAAAAAAICCSRFPSIYQPPELDEIAALMRGL